MWLYSKTGNGMEKKLKIIGNILQWFVIIALLLISGAIVLSTFDTPLHFRVFHVASGSMEPTIHTGSLVVVKSSDSYVENEILNFRDKAVAKDTVTHRIVEVVRDENGEIMGYKTKGDANEESDPELVDPRRVTGKVLFSIPYLGYVIGFAQTQIGLAVLIVIPGTIIAYSEVQKIIEEIKKALQGRKTAKEVVPSTSKEENNLQKENPIKEKKDKLKPKKKKATAKNKIRNKRKRGKKKK